MKEIMRHIISSQINYHLGEKKIMKIIKIENIMKNGIKQNLKKVDLN